MTDEEPQQGTPRGLQSMTLRGFRTIRELVDFKPGRITIMIGPNGAGKSNLISFFRFLSWILTPPGQFREYVARLGGASAILHDGPATTRDIEAQLSLVTSAGVNEYSFRLAYAAGDTLIYTDEKFRFSRSDLKGNAPWKNPRGWSPGAEVSAVCRSR